MHEFAEQVLGERAAVRLFKLEEVRVVVTQMHARTSRAKMILTVFMVNSARATLRASSCDRHKLRHDSCRQ